MGRILPGPIKNRVGYGFKKKKKTPKRGLGHPWPHSLAPPRSPFFSFFWVQFVSMWVCVCDFERENHKSKICVWFVILKGKIIDLTFVFRIFVFMFVIVFGFVFVFVILGQKIINRSLCFWFWAWLGMRGAEAWRGGFGVKKKTRLINGLCPSF